MQGSTTAETLIVSCAERIIMAADFVLYEDEFKHLEEALRRLRQEANAKAVFLIDKNGQQVASAGEIEQYDTTSLASLTAGNVTASDGLSKLIGEREFSVLFHEGQQDHIHISIAARRAILVVIFDDRSSLGLVRLRIKRTHTDLERIFEAMLAKSSEDGQTHASPFSEITDADINALFGE
jgi:predicted regulator of Ras-like GTPase activity (Roadblock/LC7/MglB family)